MFTVLHIADFPLHAVLRTEHDVARKPAALFSGGSKKSVVLATNSAARAAGVELGMSAPQAVARCPRLVIRSPRADAEADARASLLVIGFTLSPAIEDTAPGICTADVSKRSPEKLRASAEHALGELAALGLPATAGIARTPLLALYAARSAGRSQPREETGGVAESAAPYSTSASRAAPISTSAASCSRILLVTHEKDFLGPLPLAAADPSLALASILQGWGLRTLGDLLALPRDEIVRRFGAEGLALWQRAAGGSPRPLRPVVLPQTFSAAMDFEEPVETLEPLLFILRRFLDRLTLELRVSQHVAVELALTLRLENDTEYARSFRLPEPTSDAEILFRALHTHLESLNTAASIIAVALQLTPARPQVRQQGLFETGLRDPHGFAETLARVSALVGAERLGTPQLQDTHRPDTVKLAAPPAVIPSPAEAPLHVPLGLPLRRFRPPLPARLEFTDDRPTYLLTEHIRGEISSHTHPWPSSGEWWQNDRAWSRTEWDIGLAEGGVYRLLLIGDSYFLEGEYD